MIDARTAYFEFQYASKLAQIDQINRFHDGIDQKYVKPTDEQICQKIIKIVCDQVMNEVFAKKRKVKNGNH